MKNQPYPTCDRCRQQHAPARACRRADLDALAGQPRRPKAQPAPPQEPQRKGFPKRRAPINRRKKR